jgi:hypothetical protein
MPGRVVGRGAQRNVPFVELIREDRSLCRQRSKQDAARLGALVAGDYVAVMRAVVGIDVRLGGRVIRLRRHEDSQRERGHDEEHHDRGASVGESNATHAQR